MDITRAVELLSAVAQGVDPFTGEMLPESCICNQVEIVRALYCVLNEVRLSSDRKQKSQPENAGKPWTKEEEEQLLQEYHESMTISDMAKIHRRSRGAIETRLVDLGMLEKSYFRR